jgi:hypothetical protein
MESMDWERMGRSSQDAVERAMDRMQREVDRLADHAARRQEWLERKAEREARHAERWARRFSPDAPRAAQAAKPTSGDASGEEAVSSALPEPDLDQERLSILKMVEQGQITSGEAEMLLDALES